MTSNLRVFSNTTLGELNMKSHALSFRLTVAAAVLSASVSAQARDTIQIAGSSTVLPFASIVAEEFGNTFSEFKAPVVGSGGSSGGLRQFCQGVGLNTIDIANSSRPIRPAEVQACKAAGVNSIIQVQIGYDGIVFASRLRGPAYALTPKHIFQAFAAQVPVGGKMVANPNRTWKQIDPSLPNQPILLVVPASNHGTREVFMEKVIHEGCETYAEVKALPKDQKTKFCDAMRTDGRVVEVAGDYTETLARLNAQQNAVGVFGLSFYDANTDKLRVATVNGVTPSLETIASGQYPVSRPLFMYVKGQHLNVVPGIKQYVEFFLNRRISGKNSPLEEAGLIPLSTAERSRIVADFRAAKSL